MDFAEDLMLFTAMKKLDNQLRFDLVTATVNFYQNMLYIVTYSVLLYLCNSDCYYTFVLFVQDFV